MQKIRYVLIALSLLLCSVTTAPASVSIGIGLPNLSIGINLPLFPELAPVPGYPVYYAPRVNANYFFYDGMYWVYQDDNWYASSWYNGPWGFVEPEFVPLFVLRIPVRYYRQPPRYFRGWQSNAPPRWDQHWGREWGQRHSGWNRWDRAAAPRRAPLPAYQRQYSGDRYPRVEQQHELRDRSYRYQPRDKIVRQHFNQRIEHQGPVPAQQGRQEAPQMRSPRQQSAPAEQHSQSPQRGGESAQKPAPDRATPQSRGSESRGQRQYPADPPREQQTPRVREQQRSHDRGEQQRPGRGHGQDQDRDDDRGRGRDK
ncbi:MAG: hypothetical protein HGB32_02950 [Geobacteraceae bacterium]|nr:hypothetical protein [Geobacteraceae bacterium]NTW79091.1 hypothetical protein [Geobacteraceae bacterium]